MSINANYYMYANGDTLEVHRDGHGSIWSHDSPRLPLVVRVQNLMIEFCNAGDDMAVINRCDALAKEFPNGETLVSQNMYCGKCGMEQIATSRRQIKQYVKMRCKTCRANSMFFVRQPNPTEIKA